MNIWIRKRKLVSGESHEAYSYQIRRAARIMANHQSLELSALQRILKSLLLVAQMMKLLLFKYQTQRSERHENLQSVLATVKYDKNSYDCMMNSKILIC